MTERKWASLADFINHATEEEKREVYEIVIERAVARQRMCSGGQAHNWVDCPNKFLRDKRICSRCAITGDEFNELTAPPPHESGGAK